MIKRRFFKIDHGDRDDASDSSSSSSDFDQEADATEDSEEHVIPAVNEDNESGSISSGQWIVILIIFFSVQLYFIFSLC